MTITKERMTCDKGHVFDGELIAGPIDVAIAAMKAVRCPECGSLKVCLGGEYKDVPDASSPVEERARWWRDRGELGTSSLTIWCAFTGGRSPHREFCYPLDPDDFRRCRRLLEIVPEWRPQLGTVVVQRFPWFKPFADQWERFDALYVKESPKNSCPKLYAAMQVARQKADKLRNEGDLYT